MFVVVLLCALAKRQLVHCVVAVLTIPFALAVEAIVVVGVSVVEAIVVVVTVVGDAVVLKRRPLCPQRSPIFSLALRAFLATVGIDDIAAIAVAVFGLFKRIDFSPRLLAMAPLTSFTAQIEKLKL
uniref:Uncharacterized protein n=1 Tax=Glossina pallidipes TaxID=7398 RepID=A0A1A9ZPY8_GLOPL